MKNVLIAATVVGVVAAGLIIYLRDYYESTKEVEAGDVADAADNALNTMSRHIRRVERKTNGILN